MSNHDFVLIALLYLVLRALIIAIGWWRECVSYGYNPKHFEQTGEKIPFYGGVSEGLMSVPPLTIVALLSPNLVFIRFIEIAVAYGLFNFLSVHPLICFAFPLIGEIFNFFQKKEQ